ncbi:MAG: hypothetical protein ACFFDN_29010 [Candidatus Hodarchaeota archaeon]
MKNKKDIKNICHLVGFNLLSVKEVQIDGRFRIRELLPNEIKSLKSIYKQSVPHYPSGGEFSRFCIENLEEIDIWKLSSEMDEIIIAMWLFSSKHINKGALVREPALKSGIYRILDSPGCVWGHGDWQVTELEIKKFINFWKIIKNKGLSFKDISIRYFKKAMHSLTQDDSLVNLTIAMESILLPKEEGELRYKFSLRAALIPPEKFEMRKKIMDIFKKVYDSRSKVVHGVQPKVYRGNFLIYFHLCRKIICIYLENKPQWNKLLLDELALGNNKLSYGVVKYLKDQKNQHIDLR